ncbi:DUF5999 family protein [Streptomyces diacarni]|uniref:DUF5999 family protein n=1 Tax=Streptomyces diacarni TaxID=2800381 RepID=UPI00340E5081
MPPPSAASPWIATWESERGSTALLESVPGKGLRWFNEGPDDRDTRGGLWARKSQRIGQGKPEYAGVHPLRQRLAMELLLCQVCSSPSSVSHRKGVLWMEPVTPGKTLVPYTTHPPVCLPCAIVSRDRCKRILRTGAHALRVANPRPWGVVGVLYELDQDGVLAPKRPVQVGYDDPQVRWVLANQMIAHLDGVRLVDLDEEYAHYLATDPDARPAASRSSSPRHRLSPSARRQTDATISVRPPAPSGSECPAARTAMCSHTPKCPPANASDADAARPTAVCFEQGWSLLCNGVLLFEDTGELRPDLTVVPPRRAHDATAGQVAA